MAFVVNQAHGANSSRILRFVRSGLVSREWVLAAIIAIDLIPIPRRRSSRPDCHQFQHWDIRACRTCPVRLIVTGLQSFFLQLADVRQGGHLSVQGKNLQISACIVVGDQPIKKAGAAGSLKGFENGAAVQGGDQAAA